MDSHSAHSIPDTLFSYLGVKGIAVLENLELMFSNPADFNDPFEFLPHLKGQTFGLNEDSCGEQRTFIAHKLVRLYGCNSFIFCMTKNEQDVRMWDHYADGHRGLKISLDFGGFLTDHIQNTQDRGFVLPVNYNRETRSNPVSPEQTALEQMEAFKDAVTHKGIDWEREFEYRWILPAENCHWPSQEKKSGQTGKLRLLDGKMKAFLAIPAASIRKVTVGYYSSPSLLRTVLQLRTRHQASWTVAKTRLSLDRFEFEDEIIQSQN